MEPCSNSSRPLRVVQLLSNNGLGGIEKMLAKIIPLFDPRRAEVIAVNTLDEAPFYDLWRNSGIPYRTLNAPVGISLRGYRHMVRFFREYRPDVVEIYGLKACVMGRLAARRARVPVVVTGLICTDDHRRLPHVLLDRWTSGNVALHIANAEAVRQVHLLREKFPSNKVVTLYDGIPTEEYYSDEIERAEGRREFGYTEEDIVCMHLANFRHQKGHVYLVEAAPALLRACPKIQFLLVGRDDLNGQLQRRVQELGIASHFCFAGVRRDVRRLWNAADIAILPSLHEGLPISLIEAMCTGKAVVATAVSGIPELVVDGATGYLVPKSDQPEFARIFIERVSRLAGSPELRQVMGQAGRSRVLEHFNIRRMVDQLTELYEKLVRDAEQTT